MSEQPATGNKVCPFCHERFFSTAYLVHMDLELDIQNLKKELAK